MAISIFPGDKLVIDGLEYPVVSCAEWVTDRMSQSSFARIATKTATVKRSSVSEGKRQPAAVVSGLSLKCFPPDPFSAEQASGRQGFTSLETPFVGLQTYASDGTGFVYIVLERIKK